MRQIITIISFIFLTACQPSTVELDLSNWHTIYGRSLNRDSALPLYQIASPSNWVCQNPLPETSTMDTRLPLITFFCPENVLITVHNFPFNDISQRIPPFAQIARWKRQFTTLDCGTEISKPQAFSGFQGVLWEATGWIEGQKQSVIAIALQMGSIPLRMLKNEYNDQSKIVQMSSDITIKAVGPVQSIQKSRKQIIQFIRSFELIEDINASY